ncbi:Qor NADPH:quinone reductase [Pyrenophora tritici-repentis]|nr:Qor NADPH:quinone reductase [Pyrenophora tritici-repentis]KAI1581683.1 Qor NADPH:quinone reductase [Pyrenophora tritici-repentis]
MAIEAVRQIADEGLAITLFRLRDISIKRTMIVPDSKDGLEVVLSMNRVDESSVSVSNAWCRFQISSYNPAGDDWVEHCTVYIAVEYATTTGPIDGGREARGESAIRRRELENAENRCQAAFDMFRAYENMATVGLQVGPLFRNGSDARGTGSQGRAVIGRMTVPDIATSMLKQHFSPHFIHPATFDSMIHFVLAAIMDLFGATSLKNPAVLMFIKDVWLSTELSPLPGHKYRVHGRTERVAFEKYDNDVLVWDEAATGDARMLVTGIHATPLDSADQRAATSRELCHEVKWPMYLETISQADLSVENSPLGSDRLTAEWGHLHNYLQWLEQPEHWTKEDKVSSVSRSDFEAIRYNEAAKAELYSKIQGYKAEGRLAYRMGSNIVSVLRGETDPLQLMFGQDDILDQVYSDLVRLGDLPELLARYLQILDGNRTNLRVLEGRRNRARDRFKSWQSIFEYQVLHAEKDIESQGFGSGTYDIVVAQNVIHATEDLHSTLANLRKLLKPGGRIVIQEGESRRWSPFASKEQWETLLSGAGFDGVELELKDAQTPVSHTQSILVSRAVEHSAALNVLPEKVIVVVPERIGSDLVSGLRQQLQSTLESGDISITPVLELKDQDLAQSLCISLLEMDNPIMPILTSEEYEGVRKMLTECRALLWITGDMVANPGNGISLGVIRTVRWERDLDDANLSSSALFNSPAPSPEMKFRATGGVGQAAINYAKSVGAEIFATFSTPEKRDLLVQNYGIAEDHIFSSRDMKFAKSVQQITGGYGVDVVLNSLAGDALRCSWDLLAPFGRFIEIGKKDIQSNSRIELRPLLRSTSITCVDLVTMMKCRPQLVKQLTEDTIRLWSEGVVKTATPTTVSPLSKLVEGFETLRSGRGTGKMVFVPHADDVAPIVPEQQTPFFFKQDATYVLSDGLGGLGRSIARWMVSRGARNLLFLSRSENITPVVAEMEKLLAEQKCRVQIAKCDVTNAAELVRVLDQCKSSLPPIKGDIQGAMQLSNITYDAYMAVLKPKVLGSWNLHKYLPADLDHFVFLSSATGILGNRGQANYAAGNTYQDALAEYRRSQGLSANTIDVGAILSVGYVAEHSPRIAINKGVSVELEQIREEELHAILEYAIDPRQNPPTHVVTGLANRDKYRTKGMPTPSFMSFPLFAHLNSESLIGSASPERTEIPVEALLAQSTTLDEAADIIKTAVTGRLASLLSVAAADIDEDKSVSADGIDSLVAIEFRTFLAREVKADVPMLDVMGTSTIKVLCRKIAPLSRAVEVKQDQKGSE